ncbi:DNA-processing protein DprA [Terrimonas alba]|uniref:DNA-processing protein DprA n=1 Tax=Terrimonas alba TaxID=3349636 RepID=UPI0035F271E3
MAELLFQLALTLVPNIGPVQAKILLQHFDVQEIFKAKKSQLEKLEGIGSVRAESIKSFADFSKAEEEIAFIEKYKIKALFIADKGYPERLLNCYDSPTLLFYKGEADLNHKKIISIIGTRNHTDYGKQITETLIEELIEQDVMVISGLAYGIDAIAHKAALKNNLRTIGVLAHGLDQVYPLQHTGLAKEMIKAGGGLLTEFRSKTKPDKHNFPTRNRIVAGLSDATIVIETGAKGGSMITAELANNYNKDVFAFPGKVTDAKSAGCNYLIKNNKAILLTDALELIELMGWDEVSSRSAKPKKQKELFIELNDDEKVIIGILREKEQVHIDEINLKSGLSSSSVAAAILNLELQNVVLSLPGKVYQIA